VIFKYYPQYLCGMCLGRCERQRLSDIGLTDIVGVSEGLVTMMEGFGSLLGNCISEGGSAPDLTFT